MTVSRNTGIFNTIHMLHQILDFSTIFLRKAITGSIRNIHNRSTSLYDRLYHASQILIIRTSSILRIEFHILDVFFSILYSSNSTLDDFFTIRIELIFDMAIACTNTRMNTLMLSILQSLGSTVNIFLHRTSKGTNRRPSHGFRNLHNRIEITWTRDRETSFDNINAE